MVMQKKDIYKGGRKKTRTAQGVRKECAFFIAIFYFYAGCGSEWYGQSRERAEFPPCHCGPSEGFQQTIL